MKLKQKEVAIKLRQKGYSLNEIVDRVKVSKSSVSLWVRDVTLSKAAAKRISLRFTAGQKASQVAHKKITTQKLATAQSFASGILSEARIDKNTELIACALLYWCEGEKSVSDRAFSFTNSDPLLMRGFLSLFRRSFVVDESKFRVSVHLHDYHDPETQLKFWEKVTTIPRQQFIKPFLKPHTSKVIRPGYPGCVQIRYHDVAVARKIQAVAREFLNRSVRQGP